MLIVLVVARHSEMADGVLEDDAGIVESKPKTKVTAQLSQTLTEDPANVVANVKAEVSVEIVTTTLRLIV